MFIKIGYVPLLDMDLTDRQKAKLFLLTPLILVLSPVFMIIGLAIAVLIYAFMLPEWIKSIMYDEPGVQDEKQE
jgi:hypothetical protein